MTTVASLFPSDGQQTKCSFSVTRVRDPSYNISYAFCEYDEHKPNAY
jgi:hypothetical protein